MRIAASARARNGASDLAVAFGKRRLERRHLEPLPAHLQREPHLAGEGGVLPPPAVEGRLAGARRRRREPDVGGRGEGVEEGLLARLGELVGMGEPDLERAAAGAHHRRLTALRPVILAPVIARRGATKQSSCGVRPVRRPGSLRFTRADAALGPPPAAGQMEPRMRRRHGDVPALGEAGMALPPIVEAVRRPADLPGRHPGVAGPGERVEEEPVLMGLERGEGTGHERAFRFVCSFYVLIKAAELEAVTSPSSSPSRSRCGDGRPTPGPSRAFAESVAPVPGLA